MSRGEGSTGGTGVVRKALRYEFCHEVATHTRVSHLTFMVSVSFFFKINTTRQYGLSLPAVVVFIPSKYGKYPGFLQLMVLK